MEHNNLHETKNDDSNEHKHEHHHSHSHSNIHGKKLFFVIVLNFVITLAEIVGGLLSNSLSLISDAIHNLGDTLGLILAYIANIISRKEANLKNTFGYKRAEILAAFINAIILIAICLFLFKEAYERYIDPQPIKGNLMLIVAIIGLIANWISVIILQKDKNKNINIRAAYLHLMGDTLSSVAVILGGIAILFFNVVWIDPVITILVGIYIIYHTWGILKQSIDILMQGTPSGINVQKIINDIETVEQVNDIHHLHIWQLNEHQVHFEAHINVKENIDMEEMMKVKNEIENILTMNKITHTTLQIGYQCCYGKEHLIVQKPE